jgi:hypothetical protein
VCSLPRFLVSIQSPGGQSPFAAVISISHWSTLNAPKSICVPTTRTPEYWGQGIVKASWPGLRILSTVQRKSGSSAVWQYRENEVVPHHDWFTCVFVDEEAHVARVLLNRSPKNGCTLHLLARYVRQLVLRVDRLRYQLSDRKSMLTSSCHGDVGIVIHPGMGIIKVPNNVPCESRLIRKEVVSYKQCVYNTFCEKTLANSTLAWRWGGVRGLHSLDVVWLKW